MGLADWFRKLAGDAESGQEPIAKAAGTSPSQRARATASDAGSSADAVESAVVEGLDFKSAIEAHQKWKHRLNDVIAGTSTEKLDYRAVCQDNRCVLGKWINGSGGEKFGGDVLFAQLKVTHGQFHLAAGEVLYQSQNGSVERASELLNRGAYPQLSVKVQGQLAELYLRATQG